MRFKNYSESLHRIYSQCTCVRWCRIHVNAYFWAEVEKSMGRECRRSIADEALLINLPLSSLVLDDFRNDIHVICLAISRNLKYEYDLGGEVGVISNVYLEDSGEFQKRPRLLILSHSHIHGNICEAPLPAQALPQYLSYLSSIWQPSHTFSLCIRENLSLTLLFLILLIRSFVSFFSHFFC